MGKVEQNKERKRRAILQAAREAFLTEGYVQSSMDNIAANAGVTKQTIYRYFRSKEDLFQATLTSIGDTRDDSFFEYLKAADPEEALHGFAVAFIQAHLTEEHLATIRLLIAEHAKAPELTDLFFSTGPHETEKKLTAFFQDRFQIKEIGHAVQLWTGMLLSLRMDVLTGLPQPTLREIEAHAEKTTKFFLAAVS